jgi:hypothetical protein
MCKILQQIKNEKEGIKMIKKVSVWILLVCVVLGRLVACGQKEPSMGERAQFTAFKSMSEQLEMDLMVATENAAAECAKAGISTKTKAQRLNYVARGGDIEEFSGSSQNEAKWIPSGDALVTINQISKEGKFASNHRTTIKVNTSEEEASCYVTGKGNIFCWPPFIFEGKSWVNSEITAKDSDGNELKKLGNKPAVLNFKDGETVEIITKKDNSYTMRIK